MIPTNDAHLVLGLEPLETIRNLKYISKQSIIILNTHKKYPRSVIIGSEKDKEYPSIDYINKKISQFAGKVISMDFNQISMNEFDNPLYSNTIILGVGIKYFDYIFSKNILLNMMEEIFTDPNKNIQALEFGYNLID